MRKHQSRGKTETTALDSFNTLSFYERCAVRYYKVTSAYYKGKKKLIRYVHSLGLLRTSLSAGDGEVERSMKAELDEFYIHQLLDVVYYIVLLFLLISTSAVLMHHFEDWNYVDSFYWAVTTISTSGIRQFDVETTRGKQWMIVFIMIGSTTFFFAWFKILYIPIARSEKRTQLAVLNQFSGQLSYQTEIQKGEFVLMVMFLMNKINYNDVRLGMQVFHRLDKLAQLAGTPEPKASHYPEGHMAPLAETNKEQSLNGDGGDEEMQKGRSNTALNQEEILQALSSHFQFVGTDDLHSEVITIPEEEGDADRRRLEDGLSLYTPPRQRKGSGDLNEDLLGNAH
ncbi:TPK3 [Symbiodinium microadriaticum]|nr:TPK3 [Symbiodinium microadriaticum]